MTDLRYEAALAIFAKWIVEAAEELDLPEADSQPRASLTTPPVSSFLEGEQLEVNGLFAQREDA
jgi:hypothetical protein